MWLNSFYKAPLRLPMPAELEYWWSKGIGFNFAGCAKIRSLAIALDSTWRYFPVLSNSSISSLHGPWWSLAFIFFLSLNTVVGIK